MRTTTESLQVRCTVAHSLGTSGLRIERRAPSEHPYESHGFTLISATLASSAPACSFLHLPVKPQFKLPITLQSIMHKAMLAAHPPLIGEFNAV